MKRLNKKQLRDRANRLWLIIIDKLKFEKYLSETDAKVLNNNNIFQRMIFDCMTEYKIKEKSDESPEPSSPNVLIGRRHELSKCLVDHATMYWVLRIYNEHRMNTSMKDYSWDCPSCSKSLHITDFPTQTDKERLAK